MKLWVNKDHKNLVIDKNDLDHYIKLGYVQGKFSNITYINVNKDGVTKHINKDELQNYLDNGWNKGKAKTGKIWVNNGQEEINCLPTQIPFGYTLGRLKSNSVLITVNNGKKVKKIKRSELSQYINDGWVEGHLNTSTKNKRWINNGTTQLYLYYDEIDDYLNNGWKLGCVSKGKYISITNGEQIKRVLSADISEYLSSGWELGSNIKSTLGLRWVQKGDIYLLIKANEIDDYLKNGYSLGRPVKVSLDKSWVNKDGTAIYVGKDDIKSYLNNGWSAGKCGDGNALIIINNGDDEKVVSVNDFITNYKYNGWALGKICSLSNPEILFKSLLEKYGYSNIQHNFYINYNNKKYFFDFKVGDILFEINPTYTHTSSDLSIYNVSSNYHYNKSYIARQFGYRCICIWDWDDISKILNLLQPKQRIYARKCEIKQLTISESKCYINKYHLQGYAKDNIRLGLFYNNELVSAMTFGKPRYNKNYEYELVRYCSSANVIGGANKLFNYFIDNYSPKSIISYCDLSKFNGDVYNKLGFKLKNISIGRHWYNFDRHITDNLLRQYGYDKLFGTDYGKGTDNEQLMKDSGFFDIYDCGQAVYIYNREE